MTKSRWFSKWLIAPLIAVAMILTLIVGRTVAYYSDQETSTGNSSTAWTSTQWTQTSQSDFDAGVLTNVNTSLSSGDVILAAGTGSGANMILLWDTGTIPTDWTDVSATGQPFQNVFPRGAASYGGTGGTATAHTHTVSLDSIGPPSVTANFTTGGTTRASGAHTHTLSSATTGAVSSNLPSYKNLRVIRYNIGVPTTIPLGAIAIFDTTPPSGWTRYSAQDNYFVRGATTTGGTGGTNTDNHTIPNLANNAVTLTVTAAGSPASAAAHNHTFANTTSIDKRPPYIEVILAKANADTAIPINMIAMFDASPSGDWSVLSGVGGALDSRFIVGSASYGATGGASNHQPTGPSTTLTESGSVNANTTTPSVNLAVRPHTHSVTLSFNSVSNLPPYRDVIIAKALYASSGTIASQVLDTTVSGSGWDGLAWDRTLPSGTNITFEVRASDTSFLKTDVSPSWTSVGGTSPVISGLPSGRYKQWRATLTPNGGRTNTPTLSEVRVYYYGG